MTFLVFSLINKNYRYEFVIDIKEGDTTKKNFLYFTLQEIKWLATTHLLVNS